MKNKPSRVGWEFADAYLGHEKNIEMNVEDPRYRYYQWLRGWYGMGNKEVTNKCPFYQFMVFGSILMLASIIPIILMKIIDIFVLWPLSWVAPDFVDDFNKTASKSKMIFSWLVTCILMILAVLVGGLLSTNIVAWFGLVVHWIFAIPWIVAVLAWLGVAFLVTVGIPWLFTGSGFVLKWILAVIIAFINLPWLLVIVWFLSALAVIVGFSIIMILVYKISVWFFKSSFVAWIIRKSCDVREFRIRRRRDHKVKVHKLKKEKLRVRELKRLEEDTWKEPSEKWDKILIAAFTLIWQALKIFPGYPLKLIGRGFRLVWAGIGLIESGLEWIAMKIWDVIVVVWSIISETVSNHCPPIDFVVEISEKGELVPRPNGNFRFKSMDLDNDIMINVTDLPDDFKPFKAKDGRRATIRCTIKTSELEQSKRLYNKFGTRSDLDVFKIQDLTYVPTRVVRKKK
jgi:hypothetical protein